MRYHSNHCTCVKSIYDNKKFNGEAMVIFGNGLSNNFLDNQNIQDIKDFDFTRLTKTSTFFDEDGFNLLLKISKKDAEEKWIPFNISEYDNTKIIYYKETVTLKQKVIDWLNENIEDKKGTTKKDPENERKGWAIGNEKTNSLQSYQIHVFFARQKDALRFIRKWSIYQKPVCYFDYFHEDSRELNIKELIDKTNKYRAKIGLEAIDIGDKINIPHKGNTDLNEETFHLLDWEKEENYD